MTRTIAARHGPALHVSGKCVFIRFHTHSHTYTHTCTRRYAEDMTKPTKLNCTSTVTVKVTIQRRPPSTDARADRFYSRFKKIINKSGVCSADLASVVERHLLIHSFDNGGQLYTMEW